MSIADQIRMASKTALETLYSLSIEEKDIQINETKPEFEGDYTLVLFSFIKQLKRSPEQLGKEIGDELIKNHPQLFSSYNIIKGFLNLTVSDDHWIGFLQKNYGDPGFGKKQKTGKRVMVEYSSPNTNKPLHLGHLRNNFLGWSVAAILEANGAEITKTCIVNDRGIHICKSMIAWQLFANGQTPESTGKKGDHFVGEYYVKFNDELNREIAPVLKEIYSGWQVPDFIKDNDVNVLEQHIASVKKTEPLFSLAVSQVEIEKISAFSLNAFSFCQDALSGEIKWKEVAKKIEEENEDAKQRDKIAKELKLHLNKVLSYEKEIAESKSEIKEIISKYSDIMKAAQQMLFDWEAGKPDIIALWKKMNSWVYEGFDITYKRIGSDFDKTYYESNTYLLGKDIVKEGLEKGVFYKKDDGSVWIDLTADGLDEKLVMRRDGTSVYITQDIGLAEQKYNEYKPDESIYVIGDEQNYHMKVLKLIAEKMRVPGAEGIYHLSYGMVELTTGKMKSREGTVVDADDIVDDMVAIAGKHTEELGKVKDFTEAELKELYDTLGIGALKFFLLRVDPKKRLVFNPEESIDFHGFTGPFVQYTHARIKSILRKESGVRSSESGVGSLLKLEKELIVKLEQYSTIVEQAALEHNPSVLAIYVFELAKTFNTFYTEHSVMNAESDEKKQLRLKLSEMTANVISSTMGLLGIKVPERM